jgi:GNAT superfamily N-acetyltransferase
MEIQKAEAGDFTALAALTEKEGWNYSVEDFLDLEKAGCATNLIAKKEGTLAGMITLFDYGEIGWISNVLVERSVRGTGIGEAMFQEAVRWFSGKRTIELFSYQSSKGFYLKEGMKYDRDFSYVRFTGGRGGSAREGSGSNTITEMDQSVFGYARGGLLKVILDKGRIIYPTEGKGFAILRPDPHEATIGPVVAEDRRAGEELLYAAFNMLGVGSFAVIPEDNLEGVEEVLKVSRMYLGEKPKTDFERAFAFAGLEFG